MPYGNVELLKLLVQGFRVVYWRPLDDEGQFIQVKLGFPADLFGKPVIWATWLI